MGSQAPQWQGAAASSDPAAPLGGFGGGWSLVLWLRCLVPCGSQDSAACRNWASDQRELLFRASECHCSEFGSEQAAEGAGQGREA